MSVINVIKYDNLHPEQFTKQGDKIALLHTVNVYEIRLNTQVRQGDDTGGWQKRHFLQVSGALGIVHLDIMSSQVSNQTVAYLPASSPTPTRLIEIQAFDGSTFWINAGSRSINASINNTNRRYIVNIMGFFSG